MTNSADAIARDVAAIGRISAVPSLLRVICDYTGMGFAAVARVTEDNWTACAVQDNIGFELEAGDQLAIETTLCNEARLARQPIVIDHASQDPRYRDHHTPRLYGFESYISVPIMRKDGVYFGNLCAVDPKPVRVSDARTLGMFLLFAELIALQLESEDRFEAGQAALEDARGTAELREHFIAVLGHDLRTPVAVVGASADLLIRKPETADLVRIGERLKAVSRRMARLIDDVLDFTRGRLGGGIGVTVTATDDLATALHEVVEELRVTNLGREVIERIAITQSICCDRGRMQQLLANLLGNALTYGAPGQPVVVEAGLEDGAFVLGVANGGEPIAPGNLARVFEPYWRPATSKPGGGLGLGLYICAQIVKAHGGTLEANSSQEQGTRFMARLPVGKSP